MDRRHAFRFGVVALAAVALAGCSAGGTESGKGSAAQANGEVQASAGPSTAAYAAAVRENLGSVLEDLRALEGATTVADLITGTEEAHTAARDAEAKLSRLDVPPGAREANGMLVSALDTLSTDLESLATFLDRARGGDLGSLDTLLESMQQLTLPDAASEFQDALDQLEASGVDVGALATP